MTFARIGIFETEVQPLTPVVEFFRDRVTPRFATLDGFLGYQAFLEEESNRYIGISYWVSRTALEASAELGREAVEGAAVLGARIVGAPMIVRQAFDTRTG